MTNSNIPPGSQRHKPLYYDKLFKRLERKLAKFDAKSGWYQRDSKLNGELSYPGDGKEANPSKLGYQVRVIPLFCMFKVRRIVEF